MPNLALTLARMTTGVAPLGCARIAQAGEITFAVGLTRTMQRRAVADA